MSYDTSRLIHSPEFFLESYLQERQRQFGFTQLSKVKTFLWDFELFGQLQRHMEEKVVLKGGAAAQLYFPPDKQRTSVDIDVIYSGDADQLTTVLDAIHGEFGGDEVYFNFVKYTPKKATKMLPLLTYYVAVPDPIGEQTTDKPINIKIDFHMLRDLNVKTTEVQGALALGIPLGFVPKCLSIESLVGDKLLTLAQGSVGIPPEREADIAKQLYDLSNLTLAESFADSSDILQSFNEFLRHETENVGAGTETNDVLKDIINTLRRYATVNRNPADPSALKVLKEFRGNYEPRPFRSMLQWETLCRRLEYFSSCFQADPQTAISELRDAERTVESLKSDSLKNELLEVLRSVVTPSEAKSLRNMPSDRLCWEILTSGKVNVQELRTQLGD